MFRCTSPLISKSLTEIAHGRVTVHDDERYLRGLVGRLTKHHEAVEPRPWRMGDSPQTFINEMLASIVGLEIEITRLVASSSWVRTRKRATCSVPRAR